VRESNGGIHFHRGLEYVCELLRYGRIVGHFNCFQDSSTIAKLSKELRVQGVNFFARRGIYETYVSASPNAS